MVATVLTACGIETMYKYHTTHHHLRQLQQYLPLAVLKPIHESNVDAGNLRPVATVLTACGIETLVVIHA